MEVVDRVPTHTHAEHKLVFSQHRQCHSSGQLQQEVGEPNSAKSTESHEFHLHSFAADMFAVEFYQSGLETRLWTLPDMF